MAYELYYAIAVALACILSNVVGCLRLLRHAAHVYLYNVVSCLRL